MSEKRFLYMNFLEEEVEKRFTEEYDEEWGIYLSDNLTGDWYNINPVHIVDTCNTLWEQVVKLSEENENLKFKIVSLEKEIERQKTLRNKHWREIQARANGYNRIISSLENRIPHHIVEELRNAPLLDCDYEGVESNE
jgi:SMC interacting uncharacterized protein involved in chromosome segregation